MVGGPLSGSRDLHLYFINFVYITLSWKRPLSRDSGEDGRHKRQPIFTPNQPSVIFDRHGRPPAPPVGRRTAGELGHGAEPRLRHRPPALPGPGHRAPPPWLQCTRPRRARLPACVRAGRSGGHCNTTPHGRTGILSCCVVPLMPHSEGVDFAPAHVQLMIRACGPVLFFSALSVLTFSVRCWFC